ncbi:hypothetical protein ACU3L3_13225 [Priestia endophytica]|uniref:hypothetical protein n=1 Tax=Priestia endophytica TaxID=135735 RepID=UPI0018CC9023|nr:hypothetical protein [Priestia endophytica]MBG9813854.1 hypothetical protein [Priestia endophytica]
MKKSLGLISAISFVISLFITVVGMYITDSFFPNGVMIFFCMMLPFVSFILGIAGQRGILKFIGMYGNLLILIWMVIIPFVIGYFFWNQP